MCGRYGFKPGGNFYKRFNVDKELERLETVYNVAPGRFMPVIVKENQNLAVLMRWGLVPHWAKDPAIGYRMINARAETLTEKPAFRSLLASRRCLVPASGFYEWQKTESSSIPYYIHLKDRELLSFAGLYDIWVDAGGKEMPSYTIITTEPNPVMSQIHGRMPAILKEEDEAIWLDNNEKNPNTFLTLLRPYSAEEMEAHQVSTLVNNPKNDNENLIRPETGL